MREDYKECIKELKTGSYYAAWIINSDGGGKLPNNGNGNLVGPFIDALIHYWKNGGSLCFWCDNDPFSCECNFFQKQPNSRKIFLKLNLDSKGNHEGAKKIEAGDINIPIDITKNIGKFNDKKIFNDGKYNIYSLGHNLKKIAEGTTISFVVILMMYLHLQ